MIVELKARTNKLWCSNCHKKIKIDEEFYAEIEKGMLVRGTVECAICGHYDFIEDSTSDIHRDVY